MHRILVFLLAALSIAQLSAASQCLAYHPAVTVQIRDYAHVNAKSLTKAKETASRIYKRADVRIEWLDASEDARGRHNASGGDELLTPVAQLTIEIVTSSMAKRRGYSDDVLGFVTVPPEGGMGQIGAVVYERIKDVAAGGSAGMSEILGVIIAHDIGRLILGARSGTLNGVMTRTWQREELERVNSRALAFTPAETEKLSAALERDSGSSFAVGTGGSESGECLASREPVER
jgi:hypothetical protein